MGISRIEIENYKSVKHCVLNFKDINLLIGENGTGKTNILHAITFFFESLMNEQSDVGIYNDSNRFCNEFSISVTFDFSHMKKISGHNRMRSGDSDYDGFYEWIIKRQKQETLTLRKIRNKPIRWNHRRQYRQNILNLFPLYYVDARSVNLTDWSRLWDIIGDLMKTHSEKEQEINNALRDMREDEQYKLKERFDKLSAAFSKSNVQVKSFTPKQYASAISTLLFRGNVFSFRENQLERLSNGTNAFNYTNLLIEVLRLISDYKIKDPVIMLDEPEISLHHKLIDQLTERIFGCCDAIQFIASSHSPRLLKNIIRFEQAECQVIHVSLSSGQTFASPVSLFADEKDSRHRTVITDQHACAYFSRYILSVEGATETELFSNRYLQAVFPFLKNVDVLEGISDDVVQKIISPKQRHFRTRFMFLMDMDKVMNYSEKGSRHFEMGGKLFSRVGTPDESYYYNWERTNKLLCRKRIFAMAEKCRFHFRYPFFSCTDPHFRELLALIKEYALHYNTFIAATTVEGMLITRENLEMFWEFYEKNVADPDAFADVDFAYSTFYKDSRLNFARLLFNGKSDFIMTLKQIKSFNPKLDRRLSELITHNRAPKTSGWVTDWLEFYFLNAVGISADESGAFNKFVGLLENDDKKWQMRFYFALSFPELYQLISYIEKQLNTV